MSVCFSRCYLDGEKRANISFYYIVLCLSSIQSGQMWEYCCLQLVFRAFKIWAQRCLKSFKCHFHNHICLAHLIERALQNSQFCSKQPSQIHGEMHADLGSWKRAHNLLKIMYSLMRLYQNSDVREYMTNVCKKGITSKVYYISFT